MLWAQGSFEVFREASRKMFEGPSLWDILFVVGGFLSVVLFLIVLPYVISRYLNLKEKKAEFFSVGRSLGLSEEEISVFWECVKGTDYEATKLYTSKPIFEKCVSMLVKEDPTKVDMVGRVRRKLNFDYVPWFLPLTSSREIDLYQTGFIIYNRDAYPAAVWERTEGELHIAILNDRPRINPNDRVKFSFTREDDARYYFEADVLDVYMDRGKVVLILPHVDKLNRIQLREHIRWRVKLPVQFTMLEDGSVKELSEESFIEGTIQDISVGGAKVCTPRVLDLKTGQKVFLRFDLSGVRMEVFGEVRNTQRSTERLCFGLKFEKLKEKDEEVIRRFILEEQRKALRAYRTGEFTEGSSSSEPL